MIKTEYELLPTNCEFCGEALVMEGVDIVCKNPDCCNKSREKLKAWIINIAPIPGLGWKTINKLLNNKVTDVKDLYTFDYIYKGEIKPGSEKDLFNKMLAKLEQPTTASQFLLGLNIPGLGKIGAKAVEDQNLLTSIINKQDKDKIIKAVQDANVVDSMFNEYYDYIKECYNLVKIVNIESKTITETKGKVVITGTLSMKRADFEMILLKNGWILSNKVSKDTKYLITNTPDSATSKNKEADKLGVQKITEADFMNII